MYPKHSRAHQVYIKFIKTQMGHLFLFHHSPPGEMKEEEKKNFPAFQPRKKRKPNKKNASDRRLWELRLIKCDVISGTKKTKVNDDSQKV